jgi:hypothetical protein
MKRTVWIFGSIIGIIFITFLLYSTTECYTNPEMKSNDVVGYAGMIAAFSFIFVGIKNYRDKYNGGLITFGQAFKTGLYITLIASTMYVVVWLVEYYVFIPDFLDKFIPHVMKEASQGGASSVELAEKQREMDEFKEMYKNPLFVVLVTYAEIFPLGLVITLISALILKRREVSTT